MKFENYGNIFGLREMGFVYGIDFSERISDILEEFKEFYKIKRDRWNRITSIEITYDDGDSEVYEYEYRKKGIVFQKFEEEHVKQITIFKRKKGQTIFNCKRLCRINFNKTDNSFNTTIFKKNEFGKEYISRKLFSDPENHSMKIFEFNKYGVPIESKIICKPSPIDEVMNYSIVDLNSIYSLGIVKNNNTETETSIMTEFMKSEYNELKNLIPQKYVM